MKKTKEILTVLRNELRSGHYKPGSRFPSEFSLMSRFDAARTTINKITAQLEEDGFIVRSQKGAGTKVADSMPFPIGHIAYLGPIHGHTYHRRLLEGLQKNAFLKNYAVSVFSPGAELVGLCLEKIRNSKYQGLLVANVGYLPEDYPIPIVCLDTPCFTPDHVKTTVGCTDYKGAVEMAETVLAYGHREILIFSHHTEIELSRVERCRGFLETLAKNGIPNVARRFIHEPAMIDTSSTKHYLQNALKRFPDTTVIMTDSDTVAIRLFQAMQELPLKHPITLTGFGNQTTNDCFVKFPGVETNPEEIGTHGINELLRIINEPDYAPPKSIEIETELVYLDRLPHIY